MKKIILNLILGSVLLISCNKEIDMSPGPGDAGTTPVDGAIEGDSRIVDGYFNKFTVNPSGDSLMVFINAKEFRRKVRIAIHDRKFNFVDSVYIDSIMPQKTTTANPAVDGYGYRFKFAIRMDSLNLKPGLYYLGKKMYFIVKNPKRDGKMAVLFPTNTINAYNAAGGSSMYTSVKAVAISFLRPVPLVDQFLKGILASNRLDSADFVVDYDMENLENIQPYKLLTVIGHSEYWTRVGRKNLDRFNAAGGRILYLSGNSIWWPVRYSKDKTQMICYKDAKDPETNVLYRTDMNWNNPLIQCPILPSLGAEFSYGGYGLKNDSGWDGYKIITPNSPIFEGLNVFKNQIISCPGKEWDGTPVKYVNGDPIVDTALFKAYKAEVVAYDRVTRNSTSNTMSTGTLTIFKRYASYGTIINVCNTNWCAANGIGTLGLHRLAIDKITENMINGLLEDRNMFSN